MGALGIRRFLLIGFLVLTYSYSHSQGGLYQVSVDEKVSNSTLIVEGKVVSQHSYWNAKHTMIFTANQVEVYKVFKGSPQKDSINIITVGGSVGNDAVIASHQLSLDKNDIGVFYCKPNTASAKISNEPIYEVYSSSQGFLKYDLVTKTAVAPFVKYRDIEHDLYNEINNKTGRRAEIKNRSFSVEGASKALTTVISGNLTLAPVITSFSPTTVTGGTFMDPINNVLTINGSGFGNSPSGSAAILFPDPDSGPGNFAPLTFDTSLVISWTNAQIKVRVPTKAGSGTFKVRDNSGITANSPSALTVSYNVLSAYIAGLGGPKQFNLADVNGTGGYSIKYSTSTANSGVDINSGSGPSTAKATFQRALNTWKENTGVNFIESGNTSIQLVTGNDQINVVMFDNGGTGMGPMPTGVLATCYSYVGGCSGATVGDEAVKTGFDIVIRNEGYSSGNVAFTYGPCSPYNSTDVNKVDLETVLLHELGHAVSLGHIIDAAQPGGVAQGNPGKLMHFAVSYNQRRISLDYSAKAGAAYLVTPHGYSFGGCVTDMVPLATTLESKDECPASFPTTTTPLFTTVPFDLVHATSNYFNDPGYDQITTDGTSTSLTNTAFYAFRTNSSGGDLSLEVTNYTTEPASLASCTIGKAGVPVTGVQMSLYEVASCPTGQSFPAPVNYSSFKANGVLPAISGLAPDATYLMVLDGVENTKATFNVVFSGSALPLKFNDFSGIISETFNQLTWKTDKAYEVTSLNLERSPDGVSFEDIAVITDTNEQTDGTYNDSRFLPGANYYRLAVHNSNGSIEYSKVVLLTRTETFRVNIFPNPAVQTLNVEILNNDPGKYSIALHNALGQLVYRNEITVASRSQIEKVDVSKFAGGVYHLSIYSAENKRIKSSTITIRN